LAGISPALIMRARGLCFLWPYTRYILHRLHAALLR
jgi:hypothetical protein